MYIFLKDNDGNNVNINSKFVRMCQTYFVLIRTWLCLQTNRVSSFSTDLCPHLLELKQVAFFKKRKAIHEPKTTDCRVTKILLLNLCLLLN